MDLEGDLASLGTQIASHYEFFHHLASLVPAHVYSPSEPEAPASTFFKKSKQIESPKASRKQRKLDSRLATYDPVNDDQVPEESSDDDDSSTEDQQILSGFSNHNPQDGTPLQERLSQKLQDLRRKRKFLEDSTEQGRQKRQKIDQRRSLDKTKKKPKKVKAKKAPVTVDGQDVSNNKGKAAEKNNKESTIADIGSLEFASFDTSSGPPIPEYLKNRKKKPSRAQLLHMAQENKKELEAKKNTPEGQKMIEDQAWSTMLKKASGEKVKDDIGKLKKTVKREEAKKKKSKKEWDQRITLQKKSQSEAQTKRTKNIEERKQARKDRKMGVTKKKTKGRAGFEGKKRQFINK